MASHDCIVCNDLGCEFCPRVASYDGQVTVVAAASNGAVLGELVQWSEDHKIRFFAGNTLQEADATDVVVRTVALRDGRMPVRISLVSQ